MEEAKIVVDPEMISVLQTVTGNKDFNMVMIGDTVYAGSATIKTRNGEELDVSHFHVYRRKHDNES